jgi:hypothetical protein
MVFLKSPQQFVEFAVTLAEIFKVLCAISPHLVQSHPD